MFLEKNGTGGTNIPYIKPTHLTMGTIFTIVVFAATIIYAFGSKAEKIKILENDIVEVKSELKIMYTIDKRLSRIEGALHIKIPEGEE